ncbi:phage tail assembly protein [Photorhabdus temperata]|uniref:Mu-like prophage FluMu protein gp41 n=1 Tax=Photorhabdus temperata subsp. temperata Meg1 TaxID=1393735 RepID=A0A081RRT0_PHOTE|nr:phage tail assembly protein [Photorhabdus temperata]KER01383.1 Mu-like prophage FluMu protein gp41 [Photorhabdus temperata subsp. temperata Meg1]
MTEVLITPNDDQQTIILEEPLERGNSNITEVVLRKPNSGALRGARLQALLEMDVDSMVLVLPRITSPALTKNDLLTMSPGDLINLSVEVVNFLLPKSVKSSSQND